MTDVNPADGAIYTPAEVADALIEAANRFADLVPSITDPGATSPYVEGWTVDQIVRHVTYGPTLYTQISNRERELVDTPAELGAFSEARAASIGNLSLDECAAQIRSGFSDFSDLVRGADPDGPLVPYWAGSEINTVGLGAILVGECEMHGLDVAAALGQSWRVRPRHAAMTALAAIDAAAPQWVDTAAASGHTCDYEIRLRGDLGVVNLRFADGALDTDPDPPWKPQVIISADAVAFLAVFYGRRSQWSAVGRGQMIAWGRRPWHSFGLVNKFQPI